MSYCILRPNSSLLLTSSILWGNGCENIEEYYYKSVGVPVQLLPTVLGLKLAIDLDLGSKYVNLKLNIFPSVSIAARTKRCLNQTFKDVCAYCL